MDEYLLINDNNMQENIDIHIMMNEENEWKKTIMYKLFKRKKPTNGWKQQYRRIITRHFKEKKLS